MPKVQPAGGSGGGRQRRGRSARVATSLAEINVVPLVDVMLVLLIIFMVTAPMMTQGLAVNLPQARRSVAPLSKPIYLTIPRDFPTTHVVQNHSALRPRLTITPQDIACLRIECDHLTIRSRYEHRTVIDQGSRFVHARFAGNCRPDEA